MKRIALLSLCLPLCAPDAALGASLLKIGGAGPCDDDASGQPGGHFLCVGDTSEESRAVFGGYQVFGSISRTEDQAAPDRYHQGLFDFEFIFERGGTGALGNKSQSHVLSASLVKNTLGEAQGVMNATIFAPGVGDVIGQLLNIYGGGTFVPSDEGIVAYRTFIGDVARVSVASASYDAGDAFLSPRGLGLDGWRRVGEGNLVVFTERVTAVSITGYDRGTWSYSRPADADFTGMCFAHDETAYAVQDEQGQRITAHQWLPIDRDGLGTFSTEQNASDTGRDVHVPLQYPTSPGAGRVAPCERVAFVDRSENQIGIVTTVNEDWMRGSDDWNDPDRHPSRHGCSRSCTFHVVPIPNAQMIAYKAITSHKLGSPNPESIGAFLALCGNSNYDCHSAYDVRSSGTNLDGSKTTWAHGLHSTMGAVDVLAALQTTENGDEAFGEIDITDRDGVKAEVEVFRIRKNRGRQRDMDLRVDLADGAWKVGRRPLLVGGTMVDGAVCTWNRSEGAIECATPPRTRIGGAEPDPSPMHLASAPVAAPDDALPECRHQTLFSPSEEDDHFLMKPGYGLTLTGIDCIAGGGGSIALTLEKCDASGGSCVASSETLACDADGASADGLFHDARVDAGDWLRVRLDAPSGGPVRSMTYSICGTRRVAASSRMQARLR